MRAQSSPHIYPLAVWIHSPTSRRCHTFGLRARLYQVRTMITNLKSIMPMTARCETVSFDDFVSCGGYAGAKVLSNAD